jgi:hypothetical protein
VGRHDDPAYNRAAGGKTQLPPALGEVAERLKALAC